MRLAPFNFKKCGNQILITNDIGRFCYLSYREFDDFVNNRVNENSELYNKLVNNFFIFNTSVEAFLELTKPYLRQAKSYLFSSTALHIFVVTNFCNSKCIYCQAKSSVQNCKKNMDFNIARKSVDIALESPRDELDFEIQGGEPLSNFEIIKYIIEYTEKNKKGKKINYNVVTNLTLLNDEMINFFNKYSVSISTSLDGNAIVHNHNRPIATGIDSYDIVSMQINRLKESGINVGAIQTTTKFSLDKWKTIINSYIENGIGSIFLRPLTPLGYASEHWNEIGYNENDFLNFYREALTYILDTDKRGDEFIKEGHACIFLNKILKGNGINYMELRSPCGASVGQLAYYYDGNIFTCDEARMLYEMGDDAFKLGNVEYSTYDDLLNSKLTKASCKYSIIEALPKCSDCVYNCYCGTCPVINYALENDIISRTYQNYKCKIYEGMLNIIFDMLKNDENREIFEGWV